MSHTLTYSMTFDSAHRLLGYEGKCRNLHGHTYHVKIDITSFPDDARLDRDMFVMDFALIKKTLMRLDHCCIVWDQDTELIKSLAALDSPVCVIPGQSSAENIAGFIGELLKDLIPISEWRMDVSLAETPHGSVSYTVFSPETS